MTNWIGCGLLGVLAIVLTGCAADREMLAAHEEPTRVLLVLTNTAQMGEAGKPTGFFLSEAAHPWAVFVEAGYSVTLASPSGGDAPIDPRSLENIDDHSKAFLDAYATDRDGRRVVGNTRSLGSVDLGLYEAVFYAGGHGAMWDFEKEAIVTFRVEAIVAEVASRVYERGGVVAAVCHGPAALVNARSGDGWLLDGKRVTGFTNAEEEAVELTDEMPFLLETRMIERGAEFVGGENFKANVITDGTLVTGQNPASARGAAEAVVRLIERSPSANESQENESDESGKGKS